MTIFLAFVAFGLFANFYILIRVTRECRPVMHKSDAIVRVLPEKSADTPPITIDRLHLVEDVPHE